MIALVAGNESICEGPIPIALAHAGFATRATPTPGHAERDLGEHAAEECVLVLDAGTLASRGGEDDWARFLSRHPGVPAVVVARWQAEPDAKALVDGPHRILVERPFDAAAVVAAARRIASPRRPVLRRPSPRWSQAG